MDKKRKVVKEKVKIRKETERVVKIKKRLPESYIKKKKMIKPDIKGKKKMIEKMSKGGLKLKIKKVKRIDKKTKKITKEPIKKVKGEKRILVTSALPYANGPIHIGHLVEYIQTDVFVRFLKLIGKPVIYCCADDTHGTPIQLNAEKEGVAPEDFIKKWYKEHVEDFRSFLVDFDNYYTTHSKENKEYSDFFFNTLKRKGLMYTRTVERTYCEYCAKFLPDRYIRGICPKCGAEDQYGVVCEKCNTTYTPNELVEPYCAICKNPPVKRRSLHYFFKLSAFSKKLKAWINGNKNLQNEIKNFVLNWIKEGLEDWDISRDGPYFGFNIPGEENKYYYVWLDAPIGYIASTANYCNQHRQNVDNYWKDGEIIHFIGKDIVYFHFLFWPAMLMGVGFRLPKTIVVHGFLTVNKEKMSKSRGTFFTAKDFTRISKPEFLRFYYASNLTNTATDIDLDFKDYKAVINNELVANIANFFYRVLSFCNNNFDSVLSVMPKTVFEKNIKEKIKRVQKHYEEYNFRNAVKEMLAIASLGNKYFQENEPWKMVKSDKEGAQETITFCANVIKNLVILLKPILPEFCSSIEKQLNLKDLTFADLEKNIENHRIGRAEIVITKIEKIEPEKRITEGWPLDLRVAKITKVEDHPHAERLYVMQLEPERQVVGGIKEFYKKEELMGKNIVIVKNLAPATIRGAESQGMLLAADDGRQIKIIEAPNSSPGDAIYPEGIVYDGTESISFQEFTKIELKTKGKKVFYNDRILRTDKEELKADIKDNAVVR